MEQRARSHADAAKDGYYHHPPDSDDLQYAAYMKVAYAATIAESNRIGAELGRMYAADTPVKTPIIPTVPLSQVDPATQRRACAAIYSKRIAQAVNSGSTDFSSLLTDHDCAPHFDKFLQEQRRGRL